MPTQLPSIVHEHYRQTVCRQNRQRSVACRSPVRIRLGHHLPPFPPPSHAVDLIQPTDAITRERLSQPAAILGDRFGLITNVISQIQAVVGGLTDASLTGADPDLDTVERCVRRPERAATTLEPDPPPTGTVSDPPDPRGWGPKNASTQTIPGEKGQFTSMQSLPGKAVERRQQPLARARGACRAPTIDRIAHQRMLTHREMHSDLMGATRFQTDIKVGVCAPNRCAIR